MNMMPLITVIIPVFNVEKYLARCLDSVCAQTYSNIEIIVVDDGSTDGSGALCDKYEKKDSRIKVVHKVNGGLSSARNAGIRIAHGDYLGFVDSDDYIEPRMYETLLQACIQNDCAISVCGFNYVFDDGSTISKSSIEKSQVFDFDRAITEMNTYRLFDMGAWSKLYRKNLFEGIFFPEGRLSEDFFVMPQLFSKAGKVAFVTDALYNYYQRENSITKSKKINHDFEDAAFEQMKFLDKYHSEVSNVGHVAYASSVLTVFDSYLKNGVKCPMQYVRHAKKIISMNFRYIENSTYLSTLKRVQFRVFMFSKHIYTIMFLIFRKIKRV